MSEREIMNGIDKQRHEMGSSKEVEIKRREKKQRVERKEM